MILGGEGCCNNSWLFIVQYFIFCHKFASFKVHCCFPHWWIPPLVSSHPRRQLSKVTFHILSETTQGSQALMWSEITLGELSYDQKSSNLTFLMIIWYHHSLRFCPSSGSSTSFSTWWVPSSMSAFGATSSSMGGNWHKSDLNHGSWIVMFVFRSTFYIYS